MIFNIPDLVPKWEVDFFSSVAVIIFLFTLPFTYIVAFEFALRVMLRQERLPVAQRVKASLAKWTSSLSNLGTVETDR